jgi:hypothetical protein
MIIVLMIGCGTYSLFGMRRSLMSIHLLPDLGSGVQARMVPICIAVTVGR